MRHAIDPAPLDDAPAAGDESRHGRTLRDLSGDRRRHGPGPAAVLAEYPCDSVGAVLVRLARDVDDASEEADRLADESMAVCEALGIDMTGDYDMVATARGLREELTKSAATIGELRSQVEQAAQLSMARLYVIDGAHALLDAAGIDKGGTLAQRTARLVAENAEATVQAAGARKLLGDDSSEALPTVLRRAMERWATSLAVARAAKGALVHEYEVIVLGLKNDLSIAVARASLPMIALVVVGILAGGAGVAFGWIVRSAL